jgi:hypothetical protein
MGRKWNEVPAGVIKGAEQRLWVALGEQAEEVATTINAYPKFTRDIARRIEEALPSTTYRVADCFRKFAHRDSDLDKWLPVTLTNLADGNPVHMQVKEGETFADMAMRHTSTATPEEASNALIEQGKCFSLLQIEAMVNRHEAGDKSGGLLENDYANFFFVEGANGAVFVVDVGRCDDGWRVFVRRFGFDGRWDAGGRSFFRNLTF